MKSPMTNATLSSDGAEWEVEAATGLRLLYGATDLRRERTGFHGLISLFLNNAILAHDTFNVGRNEERSRLAKSAHGAAGDLLTAAYPLAQMKHDLDLFCLWLVNEWEERRYAIQEIDPNVLPTPRGFALRPYVVDGASTVMFGPPGAGKSTVAQIMAVCIACGISPLPLWEVQRRPVLYVNMERPADMVTRREAAIRGVLGIKGRSGVSYLHARGVSLSSLSRRIRRWTAEHPSSVVFYDSISRAGFGSLLEDQTATAYIDTTSAISPTAFSIGHTPRADATHIFGSMHFEAGEDIGIRLSSESKYNTLGVCLSVVKINEGAKPKPEYFALDFAEDGALAAIRVARPTEFPELMLDAGKSRPERVKAYLLGVEEATPTEVAKATGIDIGDVSRILNSPDFVLSHKEGRSKFFRLAEDSPPEDPPF